MVVPSDLLVRNNQLTFEFIGHYTQTCEDPTNSALWAHVDTNSRIALSGDLLPLADDLKLLPLPFFDAQLARPPVIPIVFGATPSLTGAGSGGRGEFVVRGAGRLSADAVSCVGGNAAAGQCGADRGRRERAAAGAESIGPQ